MTMGVVVVVLVGDRAVGVDVGLVVGLDDVELFGWPCSLLEVCLAELARGLDVELDVVKDVEMSSSMWGSMYSLMSRCTRLKILVLDEGEGDQDDVEMSSSMYSLMSRCRAHCGARDVLEGVENVELAVGLDVLGGVEMLSSL